MNYYNLIDKMEEEFDEAQIWSGVDHEKGDWEFYATRKMGDRIKEWIGHGEDPIEAYYDKKEKRIV